MKYHKIQTIFLRDPENKYKTLLEGQFALPEFEYLANNLWVFTEKIDGTNIRIIWDGERVSFGGRTDNAQIPTFLYNRLSELFPSELFLNLYKENPMVLYGEGYGAKIQSGGNYIPDGVNFILFDINIGNWMPRDVVEDIAGKLSIQTVPIVGEGTLYDAVELVREGFKSKVGTQIAEGLVMRPSVELVGRTGNRIISKIKYKDFTRS